jgi:putative zinc finger protein
MDNQRSRGLAPDHCRNAKIDYQSGSEQPHSKGSAGLKSEALIMLCAHAEKLIPLFAGDDLPAREADALRLHMESCAGCRRLAAEFEESRDWLREFSAPQFDESTLDGMRDSVLRDIARIENRTRRVQWIVPGWNLRFMASMSMLLLIAIVAAYAYRGARPRPVPDKKDMVIIKPGFGQNDERVKPSPVPAQRSLRKRLRIIPAARPVKSPDQEIAHMSLSSSPINIEPVFGPPGGDIGKHDAMFNREMTRIEFQTADPNIRIIWLTPKDSNSSSTKPAINSQ